MWPRGPSPAVAESLHETKNLALGSWPWRGIARGVAVFGSPGIERDAPLLDGLFEDHERLAGWLSAADQTLSYDA